MTYIKKITNLFNTNIKTSEIAKETGLSHQLITKYRSGDAKIENMQLKSAEEIIKFIEKMEEIEMNKKAYLIFAEELEGEGTTLQSVVASSYNENEALNEFDSLIKSSVSRNEKGGYTLAVVTGEFDDLEDAEQEEFKMIKTVYLNNDDEVVTELYNDDEEIYHSEKTVREFWK